MSKPNRITIEDIANDMFRRIVKTVTLPACVEEGVNGR
jgi:hypothetical protein